MDITRWSAIDRYYLDLFTESDPRRERAKTNPDRPDLRLGDSLGSFLEVLVKALQPGLVLEIGTLGGYSTAWLAGGLSADGRLVSLEIDPQMAALARQNLEPFPFRDQIEIRQGDALAAMRAMAAEGHRPFDLIFIDGEKSQYPDYLALCLALSQPGTLIIADNVVKHGRVYNDRIDSPSRVGISAFHEMVAGNDRLQAAVLQTVGEKGHDGLSFILVKDLPLGDR